MSNFKQAIDLVIAKHEGTFQKRTDDPGNYTPKGELKGTKYGVSARSFPDLDIEALTLSEAEQIYQRAYGAFAAINDQRVLVKVLDLAVNMQGGVNGPATKILQGAIVQRGIPVTIDRLFGRETIIACNNLYPIEPLLAEICRQALQHYKEMETAKPEMHAWFANWEARAMWLPPEEEK